jgi:hypothetical protein
MVASIEMVASRRTVLPWAAPVPFFGRIDRAVVATVGINPSSLEFVDADGAELVQHCRRLSTLRALGLDSWEEADASHVRTIARACLGYFEHNPYDRWFRSLDRLIARLAVSLYGPGAEACHLDLVPYATAVKWGTLSGADRRHLMESSGGTIAELLAASKIRTLVLNGRSVVDAVGHLLATPLHAKVAPEWHLHRPAGVVPGLQYRADITDLAGVDLGRRVRVLGFNHNLQSSFGVTTQASTAIGKWLREAAIEGAR